MTRLSKEREKKEKMMSGECINEEKMNISAARCVNNRRGRGVNLAPSGKKKKKRKEKKEKGVE